MSVYGLRNGLDAVVVERMLPRAQNGQGCGATPQWRILPTGGEPIAMRHDHEINIGQHERLALEDEYQRLAKNLYERGILTPEAYERAIAAPVALERQKDNVV